MGNLANTYSDLESIKKQENSRVLCWRNRNSFWVKIIQHPGTMGSLAITYSDLGEHQKAGELKGIVLEKQKQLLGENHPDTLRTMGNLANTYSHLGEHQKAGELKLLCWRNRNSFWVKIIQTPCVPWVIWPTHTRPGRASKSRRTQGIVLEKQKQLLGENHPDTLRTMGSLATHTRPGRASKSRRTQGYCAGETETASG
ncbi:hypothetical protein B0H13DRAFT_772553 [Mycena leptocephala]|nr:hypothetical protein B0H13DRAFT_772553 [Mycena leptocephala]